PFAPDDAAEGDEEVDGEVDGAVDDGLDVEDDDLGQVPGAAPRAAAPQTDAPSTDAAARRSHPALPFSDPSSVSAPLNAVAGARPGLPFEGLSPEGAGGASATPPTGAQPEGPGAEQARPRSEESARHARARQVELGAALDAKIEIDPALYAESAIDRSFEDNFVLPGTTPRPWQEVPTPWNGQPGEPVATPPAAAYGYQPPYPGYDPAYPIAVSSGDETALVSAPDVRRSRTMVIIGSAILVLLAGFAIYLYLDRAGGTKTTPTAPATGSGATTSPTAPNQDQDQEPPRAAAQAPAGSNAATHDDKAAGSAADGDRSAGAPADSQATGAKDGTAGPGAAPPSDPGAVAGVPAIVPSGEPSVVPRAPGDPTCKVDLKSQPAGATVVFDGKDLGTTPLTAPLPCQLVTLTFRKAGHPDTVKELTASTKAQTLSVVLKGAEIEIRVNTIPFAARIRVNNKEVGRSPISVMVPVGVPVVLSSTKDGRATSVKVTPTENNRSFTLDFKRARAPRKPESGGLEGV
ncbi:MAG TPA: PEGA domain-containing protein, partial [Kofleriaceae bacterium]|nr:PEGA domain-containing protein [Kofleriaceae bacterium]